MKESSIVHCTRRTMPDYVDVLLFTIYAFDIIFKVVAVT